MSIRNEQCNKVCRILDDVLANRPNERDSLISAVRKAFDTFDKNKNTLNTMYGICAESAKDTNLKWTPCTNVPDNDRDVFIARGRHGMMTACIGYYNHDYEQWYESRNWFAKCVYDALYWCEMPSLPDDTHLKADRRK